MIHLGQGGPSRRQGLFRQSGLLGASFQRRRSYSGSNIAAPGEMGTGLEATQPSRSFVIESVAFYSGSSLENARGATERTGRDDAMNSQQNAKPAPRKRCACGQSTLFPLCDGSHQSQGWTCSALSQVPVERVFLAGQHLANLADRLAHGLGGLSSLVDRGPLRTTELVVLTDGTDVDWLRRQMNQVEAKRVKILGIGLSAEALGWAFPEACTISIADEHPRLLWPALEAAVIDQEMIESREASTKPTVFVSHSVTDEARLFPVLQALRQEYGLELFVCADSIPAGHEWQQVIRDQLARCDVFLIVSSQATVSSVYCAFETGMATALEKPVRVIHLEESATLPYLSHVQATEIPRVLARKPWLTEEEALLDAVLDGLSAPP